MISDRETSGPDLVVCNGPPKAGTHALLELVEAMGFRKYAFVRAMNDEEAYARAINYSQDSVFASEEAYADYKSRAHVDQKYHDAEMHEFLSTKPNETRGAIHAHVSWKRRSILSPQRVITILRNPRDTYLSWKRWASPEFRVMFFQNYRSFLDWGGDNLFFYETLFTPPEILRLARLLGCEVREAEVMILKDQSFGKSLTWSGSPSNNKRDWLQEDARFWEENNGMALESAFRRLVLRQALRFEAPRALSRLRNAIAIL